MYNMALYVCINTCTYKHAHWKPLQPLYSWSGYGTETNLFQFHFMNHKFRMYWGAIKPTPPRGDFKVTFELDFCPLQH